jgi:hypothetical protein
MAFTVKFSVTSRLAAPATIVWARAVSWAGVNAELWPIRMTAPAEWRQREIHTVPCGRKLFRSRILLWGVVPLDVHDFRLESLGPGLQFQEDSTSWMNQQWRHRRTVVPDGPGDTGCVLTDRLEIVPRFALLGFLLAPVYRLVFANRHRKLRRWHGVS